MIEVYADHERLSRAAAEVVVAEGRRALAAGAVGPAGGRFNIALAGGATPRRTYELLARPPLAELMPWEHTHVFWSDERCVDPADARSNEHMAREALLDHVPIPPEQVHPMRCSLPDLSAEDSAHRAASEYEEVLQELSPLDVVVLGIGEDGHTASLFPGSPALTERRRWVAATHADATKGADGGSTDPSAAGRDVWRVTLTAPYINAAACVVFLVSGASKAGVVKRVLEGSAETDPLPACLIRPVSGRLHWLLDEEAAALLTRRPRGG